MELSKQNQNLPSKQEAREKILALEKSMQTELPCLYGDSAPLNHTFGDGFYLREIFVPAGMLVVTKIHKFEHPVFILKGECLVYSETGVKRIKAPYYMITPAGTKRVVYVLKDTNWVTVHQTKEKDLIKIEEEIIAKTFEEVDAWLLENGGVV